MRILFLTDNFPPEVNAPAARTFEHCREWVKAGVDVTVVTCAPNFPSGRLFDGYRNRPYQSESIDGIRIVRVWSYIAPNQGFARRIVDYVSFAFSAFLAGLFERDFDAIIATSPQFFTTFAAAALSRVRNRPWVFELRDLWPESIVATGSMGRGYAIDVLERIELALYRDARLVVAVTAAFKRDLLSRGIPAEKVVVVTNGVLAASCRAEPTSEAPFPRKRGEFVVGYVGTHGLAHGLEVALNAAELLEGEPVRFLLVGDGARKKQLVEDVQRRRLSNVEFRDPVPREEVPRLLSEVDAALVPLTRQPAFRTVIPSKIFEAAAAGRPILLGVEGQARELLETYGAGVSFTPESAQELAAAVSCLAGDRGLYQRLQEGCSRLASDFDRSHLASEMLAHLLKHCPAED